ncbi:MAG: hypothetical protein AVDCRST_MAG49-4067 [uncultured Thermomicrobiales bacterium]|uniref:Na+/H+ antiporter MnhB subunit-related protein domain-containing protein n=1 Tax=uncultured Thermomicrobiales bacterium TaxID=1645740 RepID=A0A6J4VEJ3_9BACT|nr:MAG: hypothetical protein AVDCRST_MAG49-4067 [uncultured Thermomicrobiales bacterium]
MSDRGGAGNGRRDGLDPTRQRSGPPAAGTPSGAGAAPLAPGMTPPLPTRAVRTTAVPPALWATVTSPAAREPTVTTVLTQTVARVLLAPTLVVAAAVLIKGYADTGDGFSAGVIAALGVLLQFVAFGHRVAERLPLLRFAPAGTFVGLALALAVAFVPTLRGDPIMTHAPGPDEHVVHLGTLELLTAVLFDVGVFLLVFGFAVGAIGMIARAADHPAMEPTATPRLAGDDGADSRPIVG